MNVTNYYLTNSVFLLNARVHKDVPRGPQAENFAHQTSKTQHGKFQRHIITSYGQYQ